MEIRGTVTHNGEPLVSGEIAFRPEPGSHVPPAAAIITDGEYRAAGRGGIAAGTYRVEIMAYETGTDLPGIERPDVSSGVIPIGRRNYLPEKFNKNSILDNVTIERGEKEIIRDFDLED